MPNRKLGVKTKAANVRVSIVVPTFNEEKLIGRTLRNLRAVTPAGTQLIVADGRSKDRTVVVARRFARVIFEKGHSIGSGRNSGAEVCKGGVLWFVDADTFPTRAFYQGMVEAFRDPAVVCVGCHVMPEHASLARRVFFHFLNFIVAGTVAAGWPCIAGSCVAYRRKDFEAMGGFDTETASAEDMELSTRAAKRGKVVFLYHVSVPTSDRRVCQLGVLGLLKDWVRTTVMFLSGRKTKAYFAPR
ncbi:MAG: glycosyltransferase [Candidatus Micrarchaeota archaeon]